MDKIEGGSGRVWPVLESEKSGSSLDKEKEKFVPLSQEPVSQGIFIDDVVDLSPEALQELESSDSE